MIRAASIQKLIESVIESEPLRDSQSPYTQALRWIVDSDPIQLSSSDATVLQRYLAAYFYFATTRDSPWRTCNPSRRINANINSTVCLFEKRVRNLTDVDQ